MNHEGVSISSLFGKQLKKIVRFVIHSSDGVPAIQTNGKDDFRREDHLYAFAQLEFIDGTCLELSLQEDGQSIAVEIDGGRKRYFENEKYDSYLEVTKDQIWNGLIEQRLIGAETLEVGEPHAHTSGIKLLFEKGDFMCWYNCADETLLLLNSLPEKFTEWPFKLKPVEAVEA